MTIELAHWNNQKYGFPDGGVRRVQPVALACIHITGNRNTATMTDLHAAARAEWDYARREAPPSSHYYVARDGYALEAIDPIKFAAWSNGDVREPNTANPGIQRVLKLVTRGFNANEGYWLEFENVGHAGAGRPITDAQKQFMAEVIAHHAARTGLPINRETVHGHWEINGIDRMNCPAASNREAFLNDVIQRALDTQEPDMKFINANGFVATEKPALLRTVHVPQGTPFLYLDGTPIRSGTTPVRATTDLELPTFGQADAKPSDVVVQIGTRIPYPDDLARPTLAMVRLENPIFTALPPTLTQDDIDTATAALRTEVQRLEALHVLRETEDNEIATALHELANKLAS